MAQKTVNYTVTDFNRDKDKVFVLTEMKPRVGHKWAVRAMFAMLNGGVDVPEDFFMLGMAGIAKLGLKALGSMNPDVGVPLMDELLECVQVMPDPSKPNLLRKDWDADVEEITTIFKLQWQVLRLHVDFSIPVAQSISE